MDILGGTPKFNWESGDLPTTWKSFRQHAEFMFNGPLKKKTEEEKCNYLMLWIGEKGRDVYSTWTLTADERKSLEVLYEKFKSYVEPKSNVLFSRYKFQSRVQGEDEMCEQFVIALKVLVKDCAYSSYATETMYSRSKHSPTEAQTETRKEQGLLRQTREQRSGPSILW